MRKSKIKQISLAVCLALMPFSSFAAGLGKLNVSSGLGEPLKAEVELLSVTPDELSTLVAAIASEEAYVAQGIVRLGIHNTIKVELAKSADGSPILKLHSNQPISDPYLDMLIQVDWASGRLLREYTVLLDPPEYKQIADLAVPVPAPIAPPSVSTSAGVDQQSDDAANIKPKKSKKASNQTPAESAENPVSDNQKLTTKRGDTLNSIAKEMQIEGVSLDQMLVGLYENNKEAFSSGNMNRLKVGQIIKVPTKESLNSIEAMEARKSVKVHSANWNAYRNSLASAVETAPAIAELEHKQAASGKIASAEDKAAPIKAGPRDVVKLSAGEKDLVKGDKTAVKTVDTKIIALQEEATAREKTLKEAQDRAAALEKQIQDMQKLLALKSQTMLEMQKNADIAAKEAVKKPVEKVEVATVEKAPEVPKVEVNPVESAVVKVVPAVKKPVKVVQAKPQEPPAEVGFLDSLMNAVDLTILGGASGIALLGAGWMYLRNKRRKDLDSFERGILTTGGLRANTVFGNTTGSASASDTSFLTDFAQSTNGSMIDANDVDPIAEAEVYMAYGRDAQAEEILKDAISKEPKRYELHLKLLEMYAGQRDASAFEAVAGELYTTLGADDPTWAKIAAMGATIEPDNPLYNVSKSASQEPLQDSKLDASDFADVAISTEDALDFSLGEAVVGAVPPEEDVSSLSTGAIDLEEFSISSAADLDAPLEFDSKDSALPKISSASQSLEASAESLNFEPMATAKEDNSLDFDLDSISAPLVDAVSLDAPMMDMVAGVEDDEVKLSPDTDNVMDFDLGDFNLDSEAPVADVKETVIDDLPPFDFTSADDVAVDAPAFDLPPLSVGDESKAADAKLPDQGVTDFDMEYSLPTEEADVESKKTAQAVASAISDISFDLDATEDMQAEDGFGFDFPSSDLPDNESSVKDSKPERLAVEDKPVAIVDTKNDSSEDALEANEFDLSSISLDLDDVSSEAEMDSISFDTPSAEAGSLESPDVEIKLDLVAAYIDMDDTEGARELLDEVMNEGGPQQQLRAQQLLDSLA